ncbi:PD-(D/E)XK nuclease family protein [Elizabethkingia meningoseptica]|uniref:PD-(D/E)XK nuclease family protein n=1 Tax=Elizabethkingia meningoseptica TaxID=238 RepID=UPI0023B1D202|nr:PD-(D/E)XK nuclease family protein [Elizabethkingia meningoseptica]MDE5437276.1 PD-(D/E)XK nuclease family protein [Elizabethkingia meningoseptica]MDE5510378.1 PD-(D/E)XK nuclease family protein [Elizabethkingia meningoseptica]MDE5514215.1 PD-(D/E)XK nuclease family protein [Elizabethkingia meningoseptica]MDE5524862.1 PD-(D/E)XK nuclease family protein [Elizabethkingia meningoseptica]MDE5528426.1 PD-(D/E)XK nuclease family protein [Elizabethkingia meningoseptica]
MIDTTIGKFERLLVDFQKIDKLNDILPSYIEIAGYPHFENVASNILSFFFDTQQKHNLKNLVLKSLLECVDFDGDFQNMETINVYREYSIKDQKRIDIVIECQDFCVSIENKIFHWLHNDLLTYQKEIDNQFKNEKNYHVVLALKKENVSGQFQSITYEEFFNRIKANIGFYAIQGSNTYITYLLDFIQTIENHYKVKHINKEMFRFLIENHKEIKELQDEKLKLRNSLLQVIGQLIQRINCDLPNVRQWIYQKQTIVYDFTFDNMVIGVDIFLELNEIKMDIFSRNQNDREILEHLDLIQNNTFENNSRGKQIFSQKIDFFDIDLDSMAEKISNYLNQIKLSVIIEQQ